MAQDPPTDEQPAQFLATIANQFIKQGMQDEELETPPLLTPVTNHPLIRLDALFDFSQDYWLRHHQRTGCRSLNEGLEIYGLLDADLPGEEGGDVEVDETMGDILTLGAGHSMRCFVDKTNVRYKLPTYKNFVR